MLTTSLSTITRRFMRDETGATAIEYTLIASLISMAILGGVNMLSDTVAAQFQEAADAFPDNG